MDNREVRSNDAYEQMLQEKEDANMRYVAKIIHEEYYMPTPEELAQVHIPEELNNKMLAMARELDKKRMRELRNKRMARLSKVCAVFLVFIIAAGTFSVTSADAVKVKLKGWMPWFEEDHVVLNPYDYSELEGRSDYYIFSEVPDGYVLSHVEETDTYRTIFFVKEEKVLTLTQYQLSAKTYIDTENFEVEELIINGEKAFFFENGTQKSMYLMKENAILHIKLVNNKEFEKTEIIELMKKIIFID